MPSDRHRRDLRQVGRQGWWPDRVWDPSRAPRRPGSAGRRRDRDRTGAGVILAVTAAASSRPAPAGRSFWLQAPLSIGSVRCGGDDEDYGLDAGVWSRHGVPPPAIGRAGRLDPRSANSIDAGRGTLPLVWRLGIHPRVAPAEMREDMSADGGALGSDLAAGGFPPPHPGVLSFHCPPGLDPASEKGRSRLVEEYVDRLCNAGIAICAITDDNGVGVRERWSSESVLGLWSVGSPCSRER